MNLIEESFVNKEEKKKKTLTKIILISIVLIIIIIISIIAYLMYLQSTVLKLTIDGQANEQLKQLLVFEEDGTIYAPIKEIASFFGYESYNGEYNDKSEIQSKCYVQNENEVANFELGENKIYKLDLTKNTNDYEYLYIKQKVKSIGGVLYTTTEGIEKAFNISFQYDKDANAITIFTMPYLNQYYSKIILDYGYTSLSDELINQKAVLNDKLIVQQNNNHYGVINSNGNIVIEPKYDSITYLSNTGDFLVQTNQKVGILASNGKTKVGIMYDNIELMDSDSGLYVVKKDDKYGVININGDTKIYIENDEIGLDTSRFVQNNIKNKYILADNLIPVKKDNYWALYNKNGKQLTEYKYDDLGYIVSSNKNAINLLVIPDYNVLVACKDEKYTLINSEGIELFPTVADDIYMTMSGGEKHYYIGVNDQSMDAIEYLNKNGITPRQEQNINNSNNSNNRDTNNSTEE